MDGQPLLTSTTYVILRVVLHINNKQFIVHCSVPHSVYESGPILFLNPVGMGLGRTNRPHGAFGSVHLLRSCCPRTLLNYVEDMT